MKHHLKTFLAALFGVCAGYFLSEHVSGVQGSHRSRLETKELIVLDAHNKPAAQLASENGRTVLRFYGPGSSTALEVGVDERTAKFVRLFGKDGRTVAALNSLPPNGEATLYLGDDRWETRLILGALRTDTDRGGEAVNDWGLEFRRPGSSQSLFNVLLRSGGSPLEATAALRLIRSDGTVWTK
jgi:hypothetical protein